MPAPEKDKGATTVKLVIPKRAPAPPPAGQQTAQPPAPADPARAAALAALRARQAGAGGGARSHASGGCSRISPAGCRSAKAASHEAAERAAAPGAAAAACRCGSRGGAGWHVWGAGCAGAAAAGKCGVWRWLWLRGARGKRVAFVQAAAHAGGGVSRWLMEGVAGRRRRGRGGHAGRAVGLEQAPPALSAAAHLTLPEPELQLHQRQPTGGWLCAAP